jgi:hypothetical protein
MKHLLLTSYVLLFVVCACKKVNFELEQKSRVGIGINNAFVVESRYISHLTNKLSLSIDVGVTYTGQAIDNPYIPDSAFLDATFGNFNVSVQSVEKLHRNENVNYSNLIVMDMSKDWNDITDLMNLRTRALHKTVLDALQNDQNEVALGTFRRTENGNSIALTHIRSIGSAYQQSAEHLGEILLDLYFANMGGSSNLFDALDVFLDYADTRSMHENKHITVITRSSPDNQHTSTYTDIIAKAKSYGVTINIIIIGNDFTSPMVEMAAATGGFINIISSTDEYILTNGGLMDKGTPMLASIHRPLSKNIHVYRVNMTITRNTGLWNSGHTFFQYYQSNLFYEDGSHRLNNYLPIYVQIP